MINTHTTTRLARAATATLATAAALWAGNALAQAADHSHHAGHGAAPAATAAATASASNDLTDGEITRIDSRTGKLTIRHGEIKNIGMPPMTMVFALPKTAQASQFAVNDKVRFQVEDMGGTLTITQIERAP